MSLIQGVIGSFVMASNNVGFSFYGVEFVVEVGFTKQQVKLKLSSFPSSFSTLLLLNSFNIPVSAK
jgi:hypothetical protein